MSKIATRWITSAYCPMKPVIGKIEKTHKKEKVYNTEPIEHLVLALLYEGFIGCEDIHKQLIMSGLDISISKVSYAMTGLRSKGYLTSERRGRNVFLIPKEF